MFIVDFRKSISARNISLALLVWPAAGHGQHIRNSNNTNNTCMVVSFMSARAHKYLLYIYIYLYIDIIRIIIVEAINVH